VIKPKGALRSAATVATYSRRTYLINSNRLSVSPSQSQPTEPFTEKTMQYFGQHIKNNVPNYLQYRCIWKQ